VDHLHIGGQFFSKPGRHTDGVQAGDSIGAVADRDSRHVHLTFAQ
jgi:hypothetical protein